MNIEMYLALKKLFPKERNSKSKIGTKRYKIKRKSSLFLSQGGNNPIIERKMNTIAIRALFLKTDLPAPRFTSKKV